MARSRKKGTRKPKRSIYILCEGDKTEPHYFKALIRSLSFPGELVTVKVLPSGKTDIVGLVGVAKKYQDKNLYALDDDQYWIVVDKDRYPEHAKGFATAKANKFSIAFSSICFEYWIFCHFEYSTAAHDKCGKLIKKKLKKYLPGYEKKSTNTYALTADKLKVAISNAKKCQKHWRSAGGGKKIFERNPYTDVDKLVDCLRDYREELKKG